MSTATLSGDLRLHHVPAGCRLDFPLVAGRFAYVYRRYRNQPWESIAHNACTPYLDRTPLPSTDIVEYVVCYCDAAGTVTAATSVIQSHPTVLPTSPAWVSLR